MPVVLLLLLVGGVRYLNTRSEAEDNMPPLPLRKVRMRLPRPTPAPILPVEASIQKEAERVARAQITAISQGDFRMALRFATEQFRTTMEVETFRRMIVNDFAPLTHAKQQKYLPALGQGDSVLLPLQVTDETGKSSDYTYVMGKERGGWHVVTCLKPTQVQAQVQLQAVAKSRFP